MNEAIDNLPTPAVSAQSGLLDDVPRHRKRSRKKQYAIEFEYVGDKSKLSKLQLMLTQTMRKRYETRRAAESALESWKCGRGRYVYLCKPPLWKAHII